jgi:hypothetical protein
MVPAFLETGLSKKRLACEIQEIIRRIKGLELVLYKTDYKLTLQYKKFNLKSKYLKYCLMVQLNIFKIYLVRLSL